MQRFLTPDVLVNGVKFKDVVKSTWDNPSIDNLEDINGEAGIEFKALRPPYVLQQPFNGSYLTFTFDYFNFSIIGQTRYYMVDFNEVDHIHLLKNLESKEVQIMFNMNSIFDYVRHAVPITKEEALTFNSLIFSIRLSQKVTQDLEVAQIDN
jgi:hypothetical protein